MANQLIREALHPYSDQLALVSKVGARRDGEGNWIPAAEPDDLRADIELNLRELGVDQLAAVNLRIHSGDPNTPGVVDHELFDRQLTAMIAARDEGLIGGIGLSSVNEDDLRRALDRTEIVTVQNAYNLVDRTSQPVLDLCTERGISFVPFFPLGSAFNDENPVLGNPAVKKAAADLGRTPAQIALAWTLSVAPNVLLIPGTSSVAHLEENLAVADIELPDDFTPDRPNPTTVAPTHRYSDVVGSSPRPEGAVRSTPLRLGAAVGSQRWPPRAPSARYFCAGLPAPIPSHRRPTRGRRARRPTSAACSSPGPFRKTGRRTISASTSSRVTSTTTTTTTAPIPARSSTATARGCPLSAR